MTADTQYSQPAQLAQSSQPSQSSQGSQDSQDRATDGRHDFDFLVGTWAVHHLMLADFADPACTEWVEFDSTQWMIQTLGGLGNVDNVTIEKGPRGKPYQGMSVRLFDVEAGLWRIWWASTSAPGHLDAGVTGRWTGTHGEFFGDEVLQGKPIKVRFDWNVFNQDTAQWEQSFSYDDGETWVHNWRMSFTRTAE
ncbi:hypothetical protein [Catenulispora yoronensis]